MKTHLTQFRKTILYRLAQYWVERATKRTTIAGPFRGMRYPDALQTGNALHAKWLGCYEAEIIPFWERLAEQNFSLIVDVGAAEGFYAVGLARMFANARVIAFEAGDSGQLAIGKLADANNVKNVLVKGWCDAKALSEVDASGSLSEGHTLLVMDVEGAEYNLLVPETVSWLEHATILVECHCFSGELGAAQLKERFQSTHDAEVIKSRPRLLSDLPWRCPVVFQKWLLHVSSDQREGVQEWLLLSPKNAHARCL